METHAWLDYAQACGDISVAQHRELDDAWQHIGAMVASLMRHVDDCCQSAAK
ncbi:MAG: hypothetical protein ACRERE_43185 [Candidatus Entotheonellia bacterium]